MPFRATLLLEASFFKVSSFSVICNFQSFWKQFELSYGFVNFFYRSWKFEKDPKYLKEVSVEVLVLTNQDGLESEQKEYMTLKEMKSSLQNDRVFLTRTLPCLRLWQNVMKCLCRNFKLACSIVSNIPMKVCWIFMFVSLNNFPFKTFFFCFWFKFGNYIVYRLLVGAFSLKEKSPTITVGSFLVGTFPLTEKCPTITVTVFLVGAFSF